MAMFTMDRGALKCRYKSETLWLLPWGESGLRVLARHMGEPVLHDYALLPQPETESRVEIAADRASIAVGDLRAEVRFCADRPDRQTVSYYNQRGELLLAIHPPAGAEAYRFSKDVAAILMEERTDS